MSASTPVIKFKLKRAAKVIISIKDPITGQVRESHEFEPVTQMREQPNPYMKTVTSVNGGPPKVENRIVAPFYLLDQEHKIALHDETPLVPKNIKDYPKRLQERMEDEAFEKAIEAREKNKEIRAQLATYVTTGAIEIIEDPFQGELVRYEDPVEAEVPKEEEPAKPQPQQKQKTAKTDEN